MIFNSLDRFPCLPPGGRSSYGGVHGFIVHLLLPYLLEYLVGNEASQVDALRPAIRGYDHMLYWYTDYLFDAAVKGIQVFRFKEHHTAAVGSLVYDIAVVQPDVLNQEA
jgi:hypothetical protein